MPYLFEKKGEQKKLPRELDRRVKIDELMKADIMKRHKKGEAIRSIAREYPIISRKSIQYILFPERLLIAKQQYKDRGENKKQYAKVRGEKWAEIMREHRAYKLKNKKYLI